MAKAKEGIYCLECEGNLYDIVALSKDYREISILNTLKNDFLKEQEFTAPKNGSICLASIAAFICYVISTSEISRIPDHSDTIN